MKISELIKFLQGKKKEFGDLNIRILGRDYAGDWEYEPLSPGLIEKDGDYLEIDAIL